jgi:O-acetyl-ADP-ribose deacetylase (regulator of RNase III)
MVFKQNVNVVSDGEVARLAINNPGSFAAWLGAGVSVEAGVKTGREICEEIRSILVKAAAPKDEERWARDELSWDDTRRRYSACLLAHAPTPATRVGYFRRLIQGISPSFAHHATALLMDADVLKRTCLTTNFDKLIEMAFAQQGFSEYQPIRTEEEADYWLDERDKCYVVKLHGDYDTYNMQNTAGETVRIKGRLLDLSVGLLRQGGLIIVGSSGYEESVLDLMNVLLSGSGQRAPTMGLYWGVNMGTSFPTPDERAQFEAKVKEKLEAGSVSREAVEIIARHNNASRPCVFFPVWGAGGFFNEVVRATGNRAVVGRAQRYLDHAMRLRQMYAAQGFERGAIDKRLAKLREHSNRRHSAELSRRSQGHRLLLTASRNGARRLYIVYGDITSRSLMSSTDFADGRRAVISAEDNLLSAGGGVALMLLRKAGAHQLLQEIGKFGAISQREAVATSGGDLPVHYILHAAATRLKANGESSITSEDIEATAVACFQLARGLGVVTTFWPLLGAGTEGFERDQSLVAMLRAFAAGAPVDASQFEMVIVIRDESTLEPSAILSRARAELGGWTIQAASAK